MSLQFITGNSGNGKTKYLFNRIVKEAKANPRDNYLVIVPEQFTMQTQRQLVDLSENKAIMNIDVLSFKRLAYRVFDELGITNLTVLEETGKNLVLRKLAAQEADKLGVIGRNLNRIGYISEVKSLLSELVQSIYHLRSLEDILPQAGYRIHSQISSRMCSCSTKHLRSLCRTNISLQRKYLMCLAMWRRSLPFLEIQSLHLMNLLDLHLYRTSSSKSSLSFQRKYM